MISVLLVDDHTIFRSSLRVRLEQEDGIAPVGEAGTAEQAIVRARVLKPDVVLIDLLLPRKSGFEAIPEILRVSRRVESSSCRLRPGRHQFGKRSPRVCMAMFRSEPRTSR
jgi:DNA-binding NarL/FixJ family response regulator